MSNQHRLQPGQEVSLAELPTRGDELHADREKAQEETRALREEIIEAQHRLYSEGRQKLLIVLQAIDAGGKNSTIRRVFKGVNPLGVQVASFKVPSREELAHDFLWRVHRVVPGSGMIGIFNRSHYEDVLVVRVDELVPEDVWRPRYEQINDFERLLAQTGTRILKFYLHISKQEQAERFRDRLEEPHKQWKFSRDDLRKREQWDAYREAYEEALERCTTVWAPWYVIPADQKWYRDLAVSQAVAAALAEMNPQFPAAEDIEGVEIV